MTLSEQRRELFDLLKSYDDQEGIQSDINEKKLKEIYKLLDDSGIKRSMSLFEKEDTEFDFSNLVDLEDNLNHLSNEVTRIKEDIEVEKLHQSGELYNWAKLKRTFQARGIFKNFPNFSWQKFKKLVKNPPLNVGGIKLDRFVARKFVIAITQMIGNNMDLWIMNTGSEGSGKSCFASQQVLFLYTFLKQVGLIDYEFNVDRLIRSSLQDLLNYLWDQPDNSFFNISVLDEAEDLDRMNYREESNKIFKSTMRRSRKNLNIVILNTPQVGEIDTSITLARINIIFSCYMKHEPTTTLLNKGVARMVIIPRAGATYSPYFKKNLFRQNIKGHLSKQFEKKTDYYKDIPEDIIAKVVYFPEIWGFPFEEYDKHMKKENKKKQVAGGFTLTNNQLYVLYRYAPKPKNWVDRKTNENIDTKSKDYSNLRKMLSNIKKMFEENPELLERMEKLREY